MRVAYPKFRGHESLADRERRWPMDGERIQVLNLSGRVAKRHACVKDSYSRMKMPSPGFGFESNDSLLTLRRSMGLPACHPPRRKTTADAGD